MLDYCLMLHDVFMDGQNDPNPERRFPGIEQLAKRFELTVRTLKRYLKYMRESMTLRGKTNGNLKDYESIISFHSSGFDAPAIPDPVVVHFQSLRRAATPPF